MTLNYAEAIYALDDSDLDVYQSRVWLRVLRRKVCFESQRSMAKGMKISLGKVNESLQWLLENGWIVRDVDQRTQKVGYVAVIPDEQTQQNSLRDMNIVLPDERGVLPGEHSVLPHERHLKAKETKAKEKEENIYMPQAHDLNSQFQTALALVAKERLAPGFNEKKFEDAAFALIGWEADLSQVPGFADYWKQKGWHNHKPALTNIINHWQDYLKGNDLRKNGTNGRPQSSRPVPAPASERTPGAY